MPKKFDGIDIFDLNGTLLPTDSTDIALETLKTRSIKAAILLLMLLNPFTRRLLRLLKRMLNLNGDPLRFVIALYLCKMCRFHRRVIESTVLELMLRGLKERRYVWKSLMRSVKKNHVVIVLTKTLIPRDILTSSFKRIFKIAPIVISENLCMEKNAIYTYLNKAIVARTIKERTGLPLLLLVSDDPLEVEAMKDLFKNIILVHRTS